MHKLKPRAKKNKTPSYFTHWIKIGSNFGPLWRLTGGH